MRFFLGTDEMHADDAAMRSTAVDKKSVHDLESDLAEMPPRSFPDELRYYQAKKWKRGFLQNVIPIAGAGFVVGSSLGGITTIALGTVMTGMTRTQLIYRAGFTFASSGALTYGCHQGLVATWNYKNEEWMPVAASQVGGYYLKTQTGLRTLPCCLGMTVSYGGFFLLQNYWERRRLRIFLERQRSLETPLHQIAPEYQALYRAFLWDYRPLNETGKGLVATSGQKADRLVIERGALDTRLDATAFLEAMNPIDILGGIEIPPWFPFFLPPSWYLNDDVVKRRQEEDFQRRINEFRDGAGSYYNSIDLNSLEHLLAYIGLTDGPTVDPKTDKEKLEKSATVHPDLFVDRDPTRPMGEQSKSQLWGRFSA